MQTILGVDVGSYSVKVAEIERTLKGFHLVGFFEQPLGAYEPSGKSAAASQALTRILEEYNLSTQSVYTVLPGQELSHRSLDFPFSDFKKIDQTIEFEMENHVPLPLEELLIDYEFLPPRKSEDKSGSTVLVSYVKKGDFVRFLNLMTDADVDPRFVGSEPIELAHVFDLGVYPPEGAYALIDIGHEKTNVLIFSKKLRFVRTIMMGGKDLTGAIADSMNIPAAEAERMKIELGRVGPEVQGADATTRKIFGAMDAVLESLLLHLRQSFMSFQDEQGEVVQALLLCGGTSRLPGLDHYLSSRLRKNVSFLECLDQPFNQLADSQWCRSLAATALSVAHRGIGGIGVRDIQFRRGEFSYRGEMKDYVGFAKQAAVLMGVVFLFAGVSFSIGYFSLNGKIKEQSTRISDLASQTLPDIPKKNLSGPNAILSALGGKISDAQERKRKIEEEISLKSLDILKEFSAVLPARANVVLDVDDLTLASRRVRIQGVTDSFESVDQIKDALSKSRLFKNIAVENVKKGLREEVRFTLSVEIATENEGV